MYSTSNKDLLYFFGLKLILLSVLLYLQIRHYKYVHLTIKVALTDSQIKSELAALYSVNEHKKSTKSKAFMFWGNCGIDINSYKDIH